MERALKAYWEDENNRFWPRMRAALEASGAVFLTDEEREAVLWRMRSGKRGPWSWDQEEALLESVREKLT